MKYLNITLIFTLSLFVSEVYAQPADQDKKPAVVFTENGICKRALDSNNNYY